MPEFTEAEKIKAAFLQGLFSASALGGLMNEECHRMFHFMGINSRAAQHEINQYFEGEKATFSRTGLLPNILDTQAFLDQMAFKYAGSSLFVSPANLGVKSLEENLNEKSSPPETSEVPRPRRKVALEGVQPRHELHAERHEGDGDSVLGTLRKRSRKASSDVNRAEPLRKRVVAVRKPTSVGKS